MAKGTMSNASARNPSISIAFPKPLFDQINAVAERKGLTFAEVVRRACDRCYDAADEIERLRDDVLPTLT